MSCFEKPLFLYRPPYGKHYHEDFETLRFMIDAGVRTVVLSPMNTLNSFGEPYSDHPLIWKWFQTYDFRILDHLIQEVLDLAPEIHLILTIDLNSPPWLSRRLQLDSFYSLGELSLHSRWKEETSAYLRAFIHYCESRHRERVCGYILACGRTLEWIESRNDKPGPAKCAAYAQWCRERGLPENPPETFWQAVQAIWFVHVYFYIEVCTTAGGFGRFDQYMWPFYKKDVIDEQRITREEALELIECLYLKTNEVYEVRDNWYATAFAGYPMWQTLMVGGQTRDGKDATNDLSYLCLEAADELQVKQPVMALRVWASIPCTHLAVS